MSFGFGFFSLAFSHILWHNPHCKLCDKRWNFSLFEKLPDHFGIVLSPLTDSICYSLRSDWITGWICVKCHNNNHSLPPWLMSGYPLSFHILFIFPVNFHSFFSDGSRHQWFLLNHDSRKCKKNNKNIYWLSHVDATRLFKCIFFLISAFIIVWFVLVL